MPSLIIMFADDTKYAISINHSSVRNPLQSDLFSLSTWSSTWDLLFNESKFVYMCFWSKCIDCPRSYYINGKPIVQSSHHKDLGIFFTDDLNWSSHYSFIFSQSYKTLGFLCRTFTRSTCMSRKKLYISLVRSQLIYCSQIWRAHLIKDISTLERVQRRATKFILNDYSMDYKNRLLDLHILPLMYIYGINNIIFFVKSYKKPLPHFDIRDFITFSTQSTRSASFLKLVHLRSQISDVYHFYFARLVRLWNSLPAIDITLPDHTIKRKITDYLWVNFKANFESSLPCSFHLLCPCNRCSKLPGNPSFKYL